MYHDKGAANLTVTFSIKEKKKLINEFTSIKIRKVNFLKIQFWNK